MLHVNGNGGFVGIFFQNTFLSNLINLNKDISYYIIFTLIMIIFLVSINFSIKYFIKFFKSIFIKINNVKANVPKIDGYIQKDQ